MSIEIPTPTPEDKFSFGLWTVGWQARDPFGDATRPPMDTVHALEKLAELGAYGVNFHDDDLIPFGSDDATRDAIIDAVQARASPTPASWSPRPRPTSSPTRSSRTARFTTNDRDVRRFALRKVMRNIDLAAELGAKVYVVLGRPRGRRVRRVAKDVARRAGPDTRRPSTSSASTSPTRATTCGSRSSPSPTSRAATSCCRRSATRWPSSSPSSVPSWSA